MNGEDDCCWAWIAEHTARHLDGHPNWFKVKRPKAAKAA
jgi:hypothetical protein